MEHTESAEKVTGEIGRHRAADSPLRVRPWVMVAPLALAFMYLLGAYAVLLMREMGWT